MESRLWLAGLAALCGAASPSYAGGPGVGLGAIRGTVEIRSLAPGSKWRKAKPGELLGTFLLRTGPRSSVHLQQYEFEVYRKQGPPCGVKPRAVACVDGNSLVRIESRCGYQVRVLQGRISAADGKPGKSIGRKLSG